MKKFFIASATLLSGLAIKKALQKGWESAQDEPAPINPASSETSWGKAIVWTLSTATLVGLSRLVIRKGLTEKLDVPQKELV